MPPRLKNSFLLLTFTVIITVNAKTQNLASDSISFPTILTTLSPPALLLPCDGLDTCQQGPVVPRAPRPLLGDDDWKDRNCLCDNLCATYGDCCDDAPAISKTSTEKKNFECEDLRNFGGIYMIAKCPKDWKGDDETIKKCEDIHDNSDPVSSNIPITDKSTALTYRNIHCAVCNIQPGSEETARNNWELWGARLECPSVLTGTRDLATVRSSLRYENGSWGLLLPQNNISSPPPPPKNIEEISSKIIYNKIEKLINKNDSTRTRAPRRYFNRTAGISTTTTTTSTTSTTTISPLRQRRINSLLNSQRNDTALARLLRERINHRINKRATNNTDQKLLFHKCHLDPLLSDTLTHLVRRCRPKVISDCPKAWSDNKIREMCESHVAHVFSGGSTYRNVYCAMCHGLPVQQLACQQAPISTRGNFNKDFNLVAFAVLFDFGRGSGSVGTTTCKENNHIFDPFIGICRNLICDSGSIAKIEMGKTTCIANEIRNSTDDNEITMMKNKTLDCDSHLLQKQDYSIMEENNKLIIALTGAQLEQDKYQILENETALVCSPAQFNYTALNEDGEKFNAMLGYITLVGLGISIICLILHLIAFCLATDRNSQSGSTTSTSSNSAKNLASLCVSLLVAYCSFLSGQLIRGDRDYCISSAIITYYSFLASFAWMFAISLDIWRSLRMATTQLRTSYTGRKQWRKFFINSLCCWLIPAVIVIIAIIIENAPEGSIHEDVRPGFGLRPGICWFTNRRSLLIFFAAPISIVMLLNAIFFTSSALMIYNTTASTSGGPRRDFRLYLKLAVLMGLTWSVGILAGFLDTPLLWVVFIVLNTLQGLFIFLGFTCNEKMLRSLRLKCCSCCYYWRNRKRRGHQRDLVCTNSSFTVGDGERKLAIPNHLDDQLHWSSFSNSVLSTKSSHSEESISKDTDETLY